MSYPLRLVLCCIAAVTIALLLLGADQRTVSGWVSSENARSASVSRTPSDAQDEDPEEPEDRPPLYKLIGDFDKNILGDVEFLLDFAIIGHPKTGTTFTMNWLASHPEIQMYKHELHSLQQGKPAELVSQLYTLPAGQKYKRGYKAPRDIGNIKALDAIAEYWPTCKLVVGLRHPVSWFQSFYNYRVRHNFTMPPPESLIGKCFQDSHCVCTDDARFHLHLNLLGKTNHTTLEEKKLLVPLAHTVPKLGTLHNQVFLYEMGQLVDEDEARSYKYRRDLGNFLGLERELTPIVQPENSNPNVNQALDICEDRYRPLRQVLMEAAKPASEWIRTYFSKSPEVVISSPKFFNELLLEWMVDPCDEQ
jgi:hypothetical protein